MDVLKLLDDLALVAAESGNAPHALTLNRAHAVVADLIEASQSARRFMDRARNTCDEAAHVNALSLALKAVQS